MTTQKAQSCDCQKCQDLCRHEPGWFLPDELEPAAEYLRLPKEELVERYLTAHPLEGGGEALGPATKRSGHCVFLERPESGRGRCAIHPVKPYECRTVFGCESPRRHRRIRERIMERWISV